MAVTQMWTDLSLDGVNAEKRVPEKKKTRAVPAETMQFDSKLAAPINAYQSYPFISGPASE
jgi:hypothetical protein